MIEFDRRVIIRFLWNEENDANQITAKLQAQFGEHAYELRTARFWIAEVRFCPQDLYDEIRTGRPPLDDLDVKILAIFDKSAFESTCSIGERLIVGHVKVLKHLHVLIGFKLFHLRWVPHPLTDYLRQKRKDHTSTMFPFLFAARRDGWHHLVTRDKS
jgi:hypothetical protein